MKIELREDGSFIVDSVKPSSASKFIFQFLNESIRAGIPDDIEDFRPKQGMPGYHGLAERISQNHFGRSREEVERLIAEGKR